ALFLRNDHVVDPNGDARLSRFLETKLFQAIESVNGLFVTAMLVAVPDQITDLGLADDFVRKAEFGGPDFAEDHATDRGFDDLHFGVAENGLLAEVGVCEPHALVGADD